MGDPIDPAGLYGKNLDASYFTDTDDLAKHLTDRHASDKIAELHLFGCDLWPTI